MKPVLFFTLLLAFGMGFLKADAQLSIYAGPQLTSAKYFIRDVKQATESKTGFMAGVGLKSFLEGPVYFSPMLYFSRKGYKVTFDRPAFPPDSGAVNNDVTVNTIELAPLVQINFSKKSSYLFLRVGPSFDFNISGHEEFDSLSGKHISRDMKFSFGDYSYATVSVNAQLGFQHRSGFVLFAHYGYGLGSLNNADYGPRIYHRVAGISLGWKLGKKL